ncbi:aromatic amino acid aminotransferase [Brevibacillus choshinensis]|uniref:Aminotransferase n=1 Tax=Brevibacillus choshinensis TaxID=54911 RepID=A0ABR5NEZ2_BRECH|nr:aminotransferase A [Brevibacillus choshinensis]KQL49964.1 aromatic amino acid aminotransferase [Brevibacillus choshinensis]
MEHLIHQRVKDMQITGIRRFSDVVAQHQDVVSLTIGEPDFPTPDYIKQAGELAIRQNKTGYTHIAGLLELREAAGHFLQQQYGLTYDPISEIIITNGATEAIAAAMRTILDEGSEVILPGPVYPGYEPVISLCGAVPVYIDTRDTDFLVTAEMIQAKITDKTRCIVLAYPSNPTGSVLDEQCVREIAELLSDKDIFVLSDEIYSELTYEKNHFSIGSIPCMRNKTITINGLSKSHAMTGWRIGLLCGPAYLAKEMLKVHQYNVICPSAVSQFAALAALQTDHDCTESMKAAYRERRDYVYDRLIAMGMDVAKPAGTFYMFPSIRKFQLPSQEFALQLLEQAKVAVVPGDAFSEMGEGYIRISYSYSMEKLEAALNRMETFLQLLAERLKESS